MNRDIHIQSSIQILHLVCAEDYLRNIHASEHRIVYVALSRGQQLSFDRKSQTPEEFLH